MIVKNVVDSILPSIWPQVLFMLAVVISLRVAYLFKGNHKTVIYKEVLSLIFVIYILCLYYLLIRQNTSYSGINLTPLKVILKYSFGSAKFMKYVVNYIILFIPFGFFASYYLNAKKFYKPLVISLIVSLCSAGIQYYLDHVFNIDNIILNTLGAFVGYLIYSLINALKGKLPKFMSSDGFLNFIVITIIVIIILFMMGINVFSYL